MSVQTPRRPDDQQDGSFGVRLAELLVFQVTVGSGKRLFTREGL
jgi:hypothetical protein